MVKKTVIEIFSVPESLDKPSEEIKDEILKEFLEGLVMIPWGCRNGKNQG